MENNKRIGLSLSSEMGRRFEALAEFDRKRPATLATDIIKAYMDTRAGDIEKVLRVKADYEKNVEELRNNQKKS